MTEYVTRYWLIMVRTVTHTQKKKREKKKIRILVPDDVGGIIHVVRFFCCVVWNNHDYAVK